MLIIPKYAIFIKTNMKKRIYKTKKLDAGGTNHARGDDKLMSFLRGLRLYTYIQLYMHL